MLELPPTMPVDSVHLSSATVSGIIVNDNLVEGVQMFNVSISGLSGIIGILDPDSPISISFVDDSKFWYFL